MGNRTFRARVDGWSNARFVTIEGNLIVFEVMYLACACSTCTKRLDTVVHRLAESGKVTWRVVRVSFPEREAASLAIAVEPTVMPAKVTDYLSELTGLKVSES